MLCSLANHSSLRERTLICLEAAQRVGPVKVQARTDLGGPYGNGTECVRLADRTIPEGKAKVPLELEGGEKPPMNLYKNKEPYVGRVESVERIVGPDSPGETCHIIVNHDGNMPYWEGQSYGVIPPGTKINSKGKEVPHGVRLYSIASTRYGDNYDGKTASFSVRRATYVDPDTGKEDPEKRGICSNFLCDADPGAEVKLTGAMPLLCVPFWPFFLGGNGEFKDNDVDCRADGYANADAGGPVDADDYDCNGNGHSAV